MAMLQPGCHADNKAPKVLLFDRHYKQPLRASAYTSKHNVSCTVIILKNDATLSMMCRTNGAYLLCPRSLNTFQNGTTCGRFFLQFGRHIAPSIRSKVCITCAEIGQRNYKIATAKATGTGSHTRGTRARVAPTIGEKGFKTIPLVDDFSCSLDDISHPALGQRFV
jgi:hypothetical protein